MSLQIPFDNTYARLPEQFFVRQNPAPVRHPELLLLNRALAAEIGIDPDQLQTPQGVDVLAGNAVPDGADPLAQAYSGHQFGGFSPVLGDGRALLLGEVVDRDGQRRDVQLKGAGLTAFSRPGSDGRAPLGPVIREFIVSEAMAALGIPTTRALAAVATGEHVRREDMEPGGVLTRIAASHIRIGTFQFFAARQDEAGLRRLTDYVIERHYPRANGALALLKAVATRQARLVTQWMGVGFIHGVMNTDNVAISGETIDFGPCAFMDTFHPSTVYSSIDRHGRYAYDKQPEILAWNIAQLASSLLPLINPDTDAAIEAAQEAVDAYIVQVRKDWVDVFRRKIGLQTKADGDGVLVSSLLQAMAEQKADFTNTFRALADGTARDQFVDPGEFDQWEIRWKARLTKEPDDQMLASRLNSVNPAIIPRNHQVARAISAAVNGDISLAARLSSALAHPFDTPTKDLRDLTRPPADDERVHHTFCGT